MEGIMFGLFIGAIVAAWVYSDATSRGSSAPVPWAIGVFLMMIVFLPLYLICRPSKNPSTVIIEHKESTLCPHCGKYYEGTLTFCPNCGVKLLEDKK